MFRSTAPAAAIALSVCTGLSAAVAAAPAALVTPRTAAQNVNAPSVAADPLPPGGGDLLGVALNDVLDCDGILGTVECVGNNFQTGGTFGGSILGS
ncbi:hypothetical protein [Streptomyces sp. MBT27]|uniref:hypothetical protein n=1 Tax=Streptomyces sp. MBT27 TaxID=1488356 RepID=UPI00141E57F6|nr:hypothetical protein [Streptomyces sp. MBT27]